MNFEITAHGQLPLCVLRAGNTKKLYWDWEKSSTSSVIAHQGGEVVGLLAFHKDKKRLLRFFVVWVDPRHRRRGLSKKLAHLAIGVTKPRKVWASSVTRKGSLFMRWVRAFYDVEVKDGSTQL